jgi:hypothetical protein
MKVCVAVSNECLNDELVVMLRRADVQALSVYNAASLLHRLGHEAFDALVIGQCCRAIGRKSIASFVRSAFPGTAIVMLEGGSCAETIGAEAKEVAVGLPLDQASLLSALASTMAASRAQGVAPRELPK